MKLAKLFGLALVAALATMALAGTGTAAAKNVALCKEHVSPCPEASRWPVGTKIEAQGGGGKLKAEAFLGTEEIACRESHLKGEITEQAKEHQVQGVIKSAEWIECGLVNSIQERVAVCATTAFQFPWTFHIEQGTTQDGNGIMWFGPGNTKHEQPGVEVACEGRPTFVLKVKETQPEDQGIKYEAEKWVQFAVMGGNPAKFTANQVPLKSTTFGVPFGFWTETFTITSPTEPIWIEQWE